MPRIKSDPQELGTGATTIRTVAAAVDMTYLRMLMHNRNTASRTVNIWYVPSGNSPANANKAFEITLRGKETRVLDDTPMLVAGDSVRASASSGSSIAFHLSGIEEA